MRRGPVASETGRIWSNCDRVMSANRKNYFGCYAENRLVGARLGQAD